MFSTFTINMKNKTLKVFDGQYLLHSYWKLLLIGRIRGNWVSKSGNNFGNWEFIYIFNHYMMASFVGFLHKERERESKIESQRMDRKISMIDRYGRLSRQRRKPPYSCVEQHLTVV